LTRGSRTGCLLLMLFAAGAALPARADGDFAAQRGQMVREISALARETAIETGKPAFDERVMSAIGKVPRHQFVPAEQERAAYANRPVLEVGTGSGYQAAILAEVAQKVCTIEIIEPLAQDAAARLQKLGYSRVRTKQGDGFYGWEDCGPFDSIIVTAAAGRIPPPLIQQLKPGGRMVIPIGAAFLTQQLILVEKNRDGTVSTRQILPVQFVPLTGRH